MMYPGLASWAKFSRPCGTHFAIGSHAGAKNTTRSKKVTGSERSASQIYRVTQRLLARSRRTPGRLIVPMLSGPFQPPKPAPRGPATPFPGAENIRMAARSKSNFVQVRHRMKPTLGKGLLNGPLLDGFSRSGTLFEAPGATLCLRSGSRRKLSESIISGVAHSPTKIFKARGPQEMRES
jgi:hypothetical protein